MAAYIRATTIDRLSERRGVMVTIDGADIALFRRDGTVYAISNVCSHQHFSKLHEGEVNHLTVTCPMHGWRYDLVTGKAVNGSGRVPTYRTRVEGNDVFIEMPDIVDEE